MTTHRIRARDAAVRRLRVATATLAATAGVLTVFFGFLAEKAFPGRAATHAAKTAVRRPTRHASKPKPQAQSAPALVSAGSGAQPQAPQAQSSPAPTPAAAPPVAVSGGS